MIELDSADNPVEDGQAFVIEWQNLDGKIVQTDYKASYDVDYSKIDAGYTTIANKPAKDTDLRAIEVDILWAEDVPESFIPYSIDVMLQKSADHENWEEVETITVSEEDQDVLSSRRWKKLFSPVEYNEYTDYRVREIAPDGTLILYDDSGKTKI